ncbi:tyrosine-type recombinase/integrase [Paraburkholderia strydomiana]|jgi:site-specific recombinase XerD|uniref:tyrosine-type recombinase/integrase n=1 Tax=Paraburkholderia strydomiana TaxID=1245417 RepID=UPI0038B7D987
MRIFFSTGDFVYAYRPRPGFPLILNDDMTPAEPFHSYLLWLLLERGKALDLKTWESYGRVMWDFAQYLYANHFAWNQSYASKGESVITVYRDWQTFDLKLDPSTINRRIRQICGFYRWALGRGMIHEVPFSSTKVTTEGVPHDSSHVTGGGQAGDKPNLILDEWDKEPVFLTAAQANLARAAIRSIAHRLLFDLMARVGLRAIEARTFPLAAVFDPATRPHLKPGTMIRVFLDPQQMDIKLDKPRWVDVPHSLMEEMYAYAQFERNRHVVATRQQRTLLLTSCGNAYSKGSAHKVMTDLGLKVGFRIAPLMLRHSYAVHTLLLLRESQSKIRLDPLIYLRNQLGHRSVLTTQLYLDQIERITGPEALALVGEFDNLYQSTAALFATYPNEAVPIAE